MTCQLGLFTPLVLFIVLFIGFFIYVHEFIYCLDCSDEKIENNISHGALGVVHKQ